MPWRPELGPLSLNTSAARQRANQGLISHPETDKVTFTILDIGGDDCVVLTGCHFHGVLIKPLIPCVAPPWWLVLAGWPSLASLLGAV